MVEEHRASLLTPERPNCSSGWWGHVPFAFWIMVTCKPRLFVERGTHHGVSYAAFCEAVARSQLDTRCYAVDTWAGDAHAGFYGDKVYSDLKAFHDKRYASFSELLRMTFDEACGFFEDGTVDLLHIDGYHTYEAVRHDLRLGELSCQNAQSFSSMTRTSARVILAYGGSLVNCER